MSSLCKLSGADRTAVWAESMLKFTGFLLLTIVFLALGGMAYLAIWDIPPPTTTVERTLPDNKFPH